jgi:hypothetical protein
MASTIQTYDDFFRRAFAEAHDATDGPSPFDYQTRLALEPALPALVNVPTGAGKTAAIIGAWLCNPQGHRRA